MTAQYEFHPLADLFPLMEGEEFDALVSDIKANGLRKPIMLYEGKILDGRNRYRACLAAGLDVALHVAQWRKGSPRHSNGGPLGYVLSENLRRRHLTTDQRAAIAAELATMKLGDNQHTTKAALTEGPPPVCGPSTVGAPAMSTAQSAKAMNVSTRTTERAKQRMREDPEAHELAKAGKLPRKKPQPRPAKPPQTATPAPAEPAAEPLLGTACPGVLTGDCKMVTSITGSMTRRSWRVQRSSRCRVYEPVSLKFATPSGTRGEEYELQPAEAREMGKALLVYANWLEPGEASDEQRTVMASDLRPSDPDPERPEPKTIAERAAPGGHPTRHRPGHAKRMGIEVIQAAEDAVAKAVMSRTPNDVLRAQPEALIERGVTDRERFAKHAGVKDSALSKFLSGQEINYHVRDQIEAEIANLADDAPEGRP